MSQEPSAALKATDELLGRIDQIRSQTWMSEEDRELAAGQAITAAFDAFAAQAVAAHAREPDEAMVAEVMKDAIRKYAHLDLTERAHAYARATLAAIGPGRSDRGAVIDRQAAKKAIAEALDDWWETHLGEPPGQALVDEIMGALTLAKVVAASSPEKPPAPSEPNASALKLIEDHPEIFS